MAHARMYAGVELNDVDREAMRRFPTTPDLLVERPLQHEEP